MRTDPFLFVCAICVRDVHDFYPSIGSLSQISPVCRYCERQYGTALGAPGAFRDRRIVAQISALANAIQGEAGSQIWRRTHAAA